MKFSELTYQRPSIEETQASLTALTERLSSAKTLEETLNIHKEYEELDNKISTPQNLVMVRNSQNTADTLYAEETDYFDEVDPQLETYYKNYYKALVTSPFEAELRATWGHLMFDNAALELKTFHPSIVEDLQEENKRVTQYENLTSTAQVTFDGKEITMAELTAYMEDSDRETRKAAMMAESDWYVTHKDTLDSIFDGLVKVRTTIAHKLGHKNFVETGYYRMQRNCYTPEMIAQFRKGVVEHIVPIVTRLAKQQAERIGVPFPMKVHDMHCHYVDGNPKPVGTADDIFAHGLKMYRELSEETGDLIDTMVAEEYFDVLPRPNKNDWGYCIYFDELQKSFIFANFNGTSDDVLVFTHEMGHAFANHLARDVYPGDLRHAGHDIAEAHAIGMEFLTWPWMEGFFGEGTDKYYQMHLTNALRSLPYECMVDEFQHHVYERPEMTPAERNALWIALNKVYRPHRDGSDFSIDAQGRMWQEVSHIFDTPFYYIDYSLAQIAALSFWAESQANHATAWEKYRRFVSFAGTKTFVELMALSDLPTPFEPDNLKRMADTAVKWLDGQK